MSPCPECGRLLRLANDACAFHDAWQERAALKEYLAKQERRQAEAEALKEETKKHLSRWSDNDE